MSQMSGMPMGGGPQGLPPMMQMPPHQPGGGSGEQTCPMCGSPIVMPFNTANAPNAPVPQRELPQQEMAEGGQNPQEIQALLAMLAGQGGGR